MSGVETIEAILARRRLQALFQPVVSLRERRILGFEALIRGPSDGPLHSPVTLFDAAERAGLLLELDLAARETSVAQFARLGLQRHGRLFLNVTPATLLQPGHQPGRTLALLERHGLSAERVVIELTEHYPIHDFALMRQATDHYREMGFNIALDDLGAGYSGLRLWSEVRPDYVKVDQHFIQGIAADKVKQEFVRSILEIALGLDCRVIAEGVETREEFLAVEGLGIGQAQGYWFGRPAALPAVELEEALFRRPGGRVPLRRTRRTETVAALAVPVPPVLPSTRVEEVGDRFQSAPTLISIPVVENGLPVGLVRRNQFMNLFFSRFGRDLHGRKPISTLMDRNPLIVPDELPVEEASQMVTDAMHWEMDYDFVILRDGRYLGIGRVMDLLERITRLQIQNARYANPLTGLPGNVPINERIEELLHRGGEFVVAYFDLDHFKPFNDRYGYSQGDAVIQLVAKVIGLYTEAGRDFVGHVGGDDFVVIFEGEGWEPRCEAMLDHFQSKVPELYNDEDRRRHGIVAHDRQGHERFFPMLSLSIGAVSPDPERCRSFHDVAALAAEAKHQAKARSGNSLFIDRRHAPPQPAPAAPFAAAVPHLPLPGVPTPRPAVALG